LKKKVKGKGEKKRSASRRKSERGGSERKIWGKRKILKKKV
jgi:hypothetical protein